jgi:hypothetical protein
MRRNRPGSEWGLDEAHVSAPATRDLPARSHFRGACQQDPMHNSSHTALPSPGRAATAPRDGAAAGAGPAFLANHEVKDSSFSWQ